MAVQLLVNPWQKGSEEEDELLADDDHQDDFRLKGLPKHLRERFGKAADLPIVHKIDEEKFKDIMNDDVEYLIQTLRNPDQVTKMVKLSMIRLFLMTLLQDNCSDEEVDMLLGQFHQKGKTEEEIEVNASQLTDAFTQGEGLAQFRKARKAKQAGIGNDDEVTREDLARRLKEVTDRDDALVTLPITIVYIALFILIVQNHLRVYDRQLLEKAMEEYVNGRDPLETATENIDDWDTWWEWIDGPGTTGVLGLVKNSTTTGYPMCIMANRNILLGDVMIKAETFDGEVKSQYLIQSPAGQAHLANNPTSPTKLMDAAREGAAALQPSLDRRKIETFHFRFMTYNEHARMLAETFVRVRLDRSGKVIPVVNTEASPIEPFPAVLLYIIDSLFIFIVLYIMVMEGMDACSALYLGFGEFLDYLQLWNLVDWFNITMSVTSLILWFSCVAAMNADCFSTLVNDDYKLNVDTSALPVAFLEEVDDALTRLRNIYLALQWVFAVNTMTIVLKFFKAFNSNPKLRVVSDTLKVALPDFTHFIIIFSMIFLPFCLIGHILFGGDLQEFSHILACVNTGFITIMGEFGWYYDEPITSISGAYGAILPSGMPKMLLFCWFNFFMFLVLLVLLNMFLAIIIGRYGDVTEAMEKQVEMQDIWTQVKEYYSFRQATADFMPFKKMRLLMENDDDPAHKGEEVSEKSLEHAFGITPANAAWLYQYMKEWVEKRDAAVQLNRAEKLEELAKENNKKVELITKAMKGNKAKTDWFIARAKRETKMLDDADGNGCHSMLGDLTKAAEELVRSIAKVRRDQEKLGKRVDDMKSNLPRDKQTRGGGPRKVPDSADAPTPPEVAKDGKPAGASSSANNRQDGATRNKGSGGAKAKKVATRPKATTKPKASAENPVEEAESDLSPKSGKSKGKISKE